MKKTGESLRGILSVLRKSQKISENVFPEKYHRGSTFRKYNWILIR